MGNYNCFGKRKSKRISTNLIFEESVEQQLLNIKQLPFNNQQQLKYEDIPIFDLLHQIDINDKIENNQQQDQEKEQLIVQPSDFQQYIDLANVIVTEIQQKISNFKSNEWTQLIDDIQSPHYLKLYMKEIQQQDGSKLNGTLSEFIVPGNPTQFIEFMGNFKDQIKLDQRIEQFKCIKKHPEIQEQLIYLSYKQVAIVSPRDFIYFKKTILLDQNQNIWCDVSRSIVDNSICPQRNNIVRGTIQLSGYIIQPLKNILSNEYYEQRFKSISFKAESFSYIQQWSECDFKIKVPFFVAKGSMKKEMQGYIDNVYRSLQ